MRRNYFSQKLCNNFCVHQIGTNSVEQIGPVEQIARKSPVEQIGPAEGKILRRNFGGNSVKIRRPGGAGPF